MTSKEWKEYKIGTICEVLSSKRIFAADYVETGIPFYRSKEIIQKSLGENIEEKLYISKEKFLDIKTKFGAPQKLDLLLSAVGERSGIPYLVNDDEEFYFKDGNLIWFRNFNSSLINSNYLYYWLKSYTGQNSLQNLMIGSAQKALTIIGIKGLSIKLPPLETQEKIAHVLSSLDDKIELNNKINQNLEQQAQAIYNQLILTQELKEKTLSEIIEITDGTHDSPKVKEEGYYLITSKHLSKYGVNKDNANYISEEDFNKINERSKVDKYDILMSMIGTVGLVSLIIEEDIDFAVKNVGIFKTSLQKNYIYFIFSYLLSSSTQNYVKSHLAGTTQKYISLGELRNLKIKIPNEKILASFNNLLHPIYQKIIYNTNEIKILTQLRDTLLPKLMSGEIDVDKVNI